MTPLLSHSENDAGEDLCLVLCLIPYKLIRQVLGACMLIQQLYVFAKSWYR